MAAFLKRYHKNYTKSGQYLLKCCSWCLTFSCTSEKIERFAGCAGELGLGLHSSWILTINNNSDSIRTFRGIFQ